MVEVPTVLILGAGSSVHCGYPLGGQLVSQLCRLRGTAELDGLPEGWTREEAETLLTRLSRSGHYSIDAFLEANRGQADLGKFLIARELKKSEDIDRLFPPANSGWYQYLLSRLLGADGSPSMATSNLGIVTFNYDRSLETYLHTALQARFDMDERDASALLNGLPIVHVHGILGEYPAVPYQSHGSAAELVAISQQIRIIHEIADSDGAFCNPMFERAHDMLQESERIYFLGFGFHPDNVRRFRFFTPENTVGKTIKGTTSGLGIRERDALHERLEPAGISSQSLPGDGTDCNNFFSYTASLD